ncbi:MAG: hypothetical protein AAF558_10535 [Verrucomicrobiota bacterium]
MDNTRNRSRNNNRGRRRPSRNRGRGGRNRRQTRPQKKQNPILAFFAKLFGKGSAPAKNGRTRNNNNNKRNGSSTPKEEKQPEVCSPKLYIGNLSYDTTESDLFDHFASVGSVKNAEIVRDRNDRSKGFGFVEMNSVETAKTASEKFHRTDYMGRQIIVAGAKK